VSVLMRRSTDRSAVAVAHALSPMAAEFRGWGDSASLRPRAGN
jgi:hypothetical protein